MKFAVTIVSPPGYIHSAAFVEIAQAIYYALLTLGHEAMITTQGNLPERQHIVLGSNLLPYYPLPLADNAILYNLEQIAADSGWLKPELLTLFRQYKVWDYSPQNAVALAKLGITVAHILPIGHVPELSRIKRTAPPDIDILFIGSINQRRQDIIEQMVAQGLQVEVVFGIYGAQRDARIARAKLLLNIHQHDTKILEMVRIAYLLANHCTVLSEHSANQQEDAALASGVAFAERKQLAQRAWQLLKHPDECKSIAHTGFKIISGRPMAAYLQQALKETEQAD
jgi:hypothetical protein